MKIAQIGFLILLATSVGNSVLAKQYAPPVSKKATAAHKPVATGKVVTLPATQLPANAIVPGQKHNAAPATTAPSNPASNKPMPTTSHAVQPADPWRFYSYP